jgi:hypothetical protein
LRYEFLPPHQPRVQLLTNFRRLYGQFRSRRPITYRGASGRTARIHLQARHPRTCSKTQLSMTHDQKATPPKIIHLGDTRHAIQHRMHIHPRRHTRSRSQNPPRSHNHSRGQDQAWQDLHLRYRPAGAIPPNQITGVSHQQDNVWVHPRNRQDSSVLSSVGKPNHSSCVHHEKPLRRPHLCARRRVSGSFTTQ